MTNRVTLKTYEGKLTAKAYTTIRKCAKDRTFKSNGSNIQVQVYYALKKGGHRSEYTKHQCMTSIGTVWKQCRYPDYLVNKVLIGKEASYPYSKKHPAVLDNYLDWMCSNSPWSQCIISKSAADVRKYGLILDCNYPYPLVSGACIVLRNTSESQMSYGVFLEQWNDLVEAGATGTEAYLLAAALEVKHRGKTKLYTPRNGLWHSALTYLNKIPKQSIYLYLLGITNTDTRTMKEVGRQGSNSYTWGTGTDNNLKETLQTYSKGTKVKDVWDDESESYTITLTDAVKGFREWLKN